MTVLLHGVDHLSPSGAETMVQCQRKFWWRYKHKVGRDERSEPLAMGGGLAAALEFGNLETGLADYYERRPIADGWTDPIADQRAIWIAEHTIRLAYAGYLERFAAIDEGLVREQTYFVALPGYGVFTQRLIQARVDGCKAGEYLVEDKLRSASSMRADAIENEVRQGRQLTAEVYAHWKATGELLPVKLRVTRKIDPRKVKKLETEDEVRTALEEHFAGEGIFNEFTATRTVEQLAEFEAEFTELVQRADHLLGSELPAGVRNQGACSAYGRTCAALAVCQGVAPASDLIAPDQKREPV